MAAVVPIFTTSNLNQVALVYIYITLETYVLDGYQPPNHKRQTGKSFLSVLLFLYLLMNKTKCKMAALVPILTALNLE